MTRLLAPSRPLTYAFEVTKEGLLRARHSHDSNKGIGESTLATEFYVNDETISNSFGCALAPLYADWTDVALAVYLADRLSPRRDAKKPGHGFQWARCIQLKIPVRLPEVWTQPAVGDALAKALRFFTDDDWDIEFQARRGRARISESQQFLFSSPLASPLRVALLSGGLDSFAGAAGFLADLADHSFVFVSGVTNPRHWSAQRRQVRTLRGLSGRELCHVAVPFGGRWRGRSRGQHEERSQRTRGFLFLTLGAVTALSAGTSELYIHENGVGAINLPYNATQVGTFNSRNVHPLSLLLMEELASALTGRSFVFQNPCLYTTKAQMCRHRAVHEIATHIHTTFSCDGFPIQSKGRPQCGSCTSCLLRRVSLEAAGLSAYDPSSEYVRDLASPSFEATENQPYGLKAMEWQVRKISQRLRSSDPWHSLIAEFPSLQTIAIGVAIRIDGGEKEVQRLLLQLYANYVSEWDSFSARARLGIRLRAA